MRTEERDSNSQSRAANRLIQSIQATVEGSINSIAIGQLTVNLTVTLRPRCGQRVPARVLGIQRRAA